MKSSDLKKYIYRFSNASCKLKGSFLPEKRPHSTQSGLISMLVSVSHRLHRGERIIQKTGRTTGYLGGFWAGSPSSVVNCTFFMIKVTISTIVNILVVGKDPPLPKHPWFLRESRIWSPNPGPARREGCPWAEVVTICQTRNPDRPDPGGNYFSVCLLFTQLF